ncbi:MAG: TetR/AcrR family transcriptional regulator [Fimbriimonadaceae bacterium]|nr:TetR/AcrR family transcriptional regulator [Chthonomonadaceae bacterium]MCO5295537.1 TetR/AcrR family transcriptional regulator [Fimbriimonadaceae bacterium]
MGGKERLLEAARGLFGTSSYVSVGVAQILDAAGVQAPTLYHHFGDKEGLYVAWARDAMERLGQRSAPFRDAPLPLRERFEGFAACLLSDPGFDLLLALREAPQLARPASGETILGAYLSHVYEPLCSLLVQAVETGQVRRDPIGRMADVFLMGTFALSTQYGRADLGPREAAQWWTDRFLVAMRP